MGAICSKGHPVAEADDEERKAHELEKRIRNESKKDEEVHKLLLLGAGESGKSTIFKQIKVLYRSGFDEEELQKYKPVIHANVFQAIKILYEGCLGMLKKEDSERYALMSENMEHAKRISEVGEENNSMLTLLTPQDGEMIKKVWNDPAIQATYERANELQLPDCTEYFLKDVERLASPDYTPTKEDILHARVRTTGVADIFFEHEGRPYRIFDVGGQRNERRKWIHLFEGVTAVIFCAALSEYDQNLFEDETKNRMIETKELFEWVLKEPSFKKTAFVVFLNKYDIFEKKVLSGVPLNTCDWFRDYIPIPGEGSRIVKHAYDYIRDKFKEIYDKYTPESGTQRLIMLYKTTALDPNLMKATFELVDKTLLLESIKNLG